MLSGLLLAYPISIVVIYLCIDVIGMPSVFATSLNTFVLTVVAFIRVFLFVSIQRNKNETISNRRRICFDLQEDGSLTDGDMTFSSLEELKNTLTLLRLKKIK